MREYPRSYRSLELGWFSGSGTVYPPEAFIASAVPMLAESRKSGFGDMERSGDRG